MQSVVDLRLYRLAWLPAVLALVVLMFSLEGAPEPVEPATATGTFDGGPAFAEARRIATNSPDRSPGSDGDTAVADLVAERFEEIPAGAVSEQTFEASYGGSEVELRNVLLTLPGEADSSIVIVAARDSATEPGAATSAAATGILIELAGTLGVAGHDKTYVLASTSEAVTGAAGARELIESLPERDSIEAVIVISQPGASNPRPPFVIATSTDESSGPVQLERTAELAVESQAQLRSGEASAFTQLARLAFPSGLGGQAPLIAEGLQAISISSAGERTLPESADGIEDLSRETLEAFGRAIQATVGAVDISAELDPGPGAHLELADNLVPGWTLALLALALLLPVAVVAADACLRTARAGAGLGGGLAWAAARALPFVGALATLYALALVGAIPRLPFPFDPGRHELGARAAITLSLVVVVALASAIGLRSRGVTGRRAPNAAAPAVGAVAVAACLAIWLANPYLALLVAPTAHVWLLCTARPGAVRAAGVIAASMLACVPVTAALGALADALDLGAGALWTLALMVVDGQIGIGLTVPLCFLGGALLSAMALAARRGTPAEGSDPASQLRARPLQPSVEALGASDER